MSKVFIDESTLDEIANAIQEQEGSSEPILTTEMAQRIKAISGGQEIAEKAVVLQIYSLNNLGKTVSELRLENATSLFYFCCCTNARQPERLNDTVEELTLTCDQKITNAANFLYFPTSIPDTTLRKLTLNADLSNTSSFANFIANFTALEEIVGNPLNLSAATNVRYFFDNMLSLREIRFQGTIGVTLDVSEAPVLSAESIESIVLCLSDSTEAQTLTLSAEAVNSAYETEEGAADGSSSAEWTALVNSKPNWTISLVSLV